MIEYYKGAFNLNLLLIVSGSAVYRAMIPGLISVAFSLWLNTPGFDNVATREPLGHPQAIGTLLGSITLIIVFKANQAYSRNYEAYTTVFAMSSRFQDSVQHMMVYHMQCDHYKEMRPPSYFDHPELNGLFLTRDRERFRPDMSQEVRLARSIRKSINYVNDAKKQRRSESWDSFEEGVLSVESERGDMLGEPDHLMYRERLDGGWGRLFPDKKTLRPTTTYYDPMRADDLPKEGFASHRGGRTPALYLQELVHLASLLNAVALSTLRNDIDGAESPLDVADLGGTWPEVDPGKIKNIRGSYWDRLIKVVGADVTEAARTKYNASRPLEVVGGVSAAEIKFLQMARGPYAKTVLAFNWLSEFMVREHKSGSTGTIGDALISRSMQFLGNGMSQYNQARKIMIVPFPFPHAQLAAFFVLVIVPGVPLLMDQYTNAIWLGAVLSFFVVSCLCGLHEVSRELENPFRKPPNEVPICTLQAQFNEALITMFSGYHPDSYFDGSQSEPQSRQLKLASAPSGFRSLISQHPSEMSMASSVIAESVDESASDAEDESDDKDEIHNLQFEIDEHAREMQRLRQVLDEKVKRGLSSGGNGVPPIRPGRSVQRKHVTL